MESRHRPAAEVTSTAPTASVRFRVRLLAGCALLVGLALVQDPGLLASDTKFDLAVAPADFLGRALHLWDSEGAFGQVQNQSYGYLWPMGPFFLLGWLADLPGWVVQRLWVGLVMSVAYTGTARVARSLGVRSDLACILAGFAFALSPRMLTTLGPISIEAWPSALAPWVLLPLVRGARAGSPRRAAALSAVAVAMVGGVNAAATFAVVPLAVVWLLTRTPGPRRRSMMLWWPAFVLLGTLWWLVPLFLLGAYSPPFLDFIETTTVTTFPTTLFDALRGTSDWVPYVDAGSRAGHDLVATPYLVLNGAVVVLLGFVGMADRRNPHRLFLTLSVLVGVLMVTAGHYGAVDGWGSQPVRALLDGALAPLRNVHKFDPVIRLPLVLGLAFVVDAVRGRTAGLDAGQQRLLRLNRSMLAGIAIVTVVVSAMPAVAGRIVPAGATPAVPDYWRDASSWLDEHAVQHSALVVPGAAFGDYSWGEPKDEPLQFLGQARWAVRNVIPLTPPGTIRMLDEVESRLAQGAGSDALTTYLRRAGLRYLVVRNDLQRSDDVPDPVLLHQALLDSPGLSRVAEFGPLVGGKTVIRGRERHFVVNGGWQSVYPAVEIFEVAGHVAAAISSGAPTTVVGGPEDLLDLTGLGLVSDDPVVLAADLDDPSDTDPGRVVLTDGLRARERYFPRIHDGYSATLTPGDRPHSTNASRDYVVDAGDRWSTITRLAGAAAISASSSMSDANAPGGARRGELPYAAVDGSPDTHWTSGSATDGPAWWELRLEQPREVATVRLTTPADAGRATVVVRTPAGASDPVTISAGGSRLVHLDATEPVDRLRVVDASPRMDARLSLSEVTIPGVGVRRWLVLPEIPASWDAPTAVVLRADTDVRTGCARVGSSDRCIPGRAVTGEEPLVMRRIVRLPAGGTYVPRVSVRPIAGEELDSLVQRDQPLTVTASSTAVPDPKSSPVSTVDGHMGTTWVAGTDDATPQLQVSWLGEHRLTGIEVRTRDAVPARQPTRVLLAWPGGSREVRLGRDGSARIPAVRTDRLTITVLASEPTVSIGFDDAVSNLGVGIGELRLRGVPFLPLRLSSDTARYPCGTGPRTTIGDTSFETAVVAAPTALVRGTEVVARPCGRGGGAATVSLDEGEVRAVVSASAAFAPGSLVLTTPGDGVPHTASDALVGAPDPVTRDLQPDQGDAVVGLRENVNPGWVAEQGGRRLQSVTLDGWQQGWRLADGAAVSARYGPDRVYRLALVGGLVLLVVLLSLASLVGRRHDPGTTPLTGRQVPSLLLVLAALGGAGLVTGTAGAVVAAIAVAVTVVGRRALPDLLPWLVAAPVLVAGIAYAFAPWAGSNGWAGDSAWVGYLSVVPLAGVLVCASDRTGKIVFRRSAGASTSR